MNTTNIVFAIISVLIIAFNTYVFYKGYKDLQRKRQELREYKEQMLAQMSSNNYLIGAGYQQGSLYQKKLREFVFSKTKGRCAYCGAKAEEIDHIVPRSKGGTDSVNNLTAACRACNERKSNLTLKDFGKLIGKDFSHLEPKKLPKDAAIVQSSRNYMVREITKLVSNTTTHDAWLTKYNRNELGLPKQHYYDALSVGEIPIKFNFLTDKILLISAKGRGSRQMCRMNKYGFPRTAPKGSKFVEGFQTGDMVKAIVPKGSKQGEYLGKVAVRSSGYFDIQTKTQVVQGIGFEYCHIIQRSDGYLYSYKECDSLSAINNRVSIAKI